MRAPIGFGVVHETRRDVSRTVVFHRKVVGVATPGQGRWQNRQPVTVSWWPSRKQWERYYGAAGYWTPACETWFLTRLDGMRSSDIRLRNGQEWYDRLTQHKPARPFHRAHMAFCEHAVATIFGARAAGRDDEAREL